MGEATQTEHVSVSIKSKDTKLSYSMTQKLCRESPYFSDNCISKVPEKLRSCNKNSYDPNIVSIGPYHRGKPQLEPMEKIKSWYLQSLLHRLPMSHEETLAVFAGNIRGLHSSARRCYADKIELELDEDRFVEMLILDGCFLVELFRKDAWLIQHHDDDPIFTTPWMLPNLYHDLILLENQIPWFVLLRLFQLSQPASSSNVLDNDVLAKLVLKFFEKMMLLTEPAEYRENGNQIKHVLDLLHTCLLSSSATTAPHPLYRKLIVPTVTDLLHSGVKFKKGSPGDILNIKFSTKGVFEIPPIRIRGNSESLFKNLIAYEECSYFTNHQFTSYAFLLDCLINTSADAELLCYKGFIVDALSTEDFSLLFNGLYNDNLVFQFYYGKLTDDVNEYYRSQWPRLRALMSKHFKKTWSIFSILILGFTFTQTLFSILAYLRI